MATNLNKLDSSASTKIVGADTNGVESNFLGVTATQEGKSTDMFHNGFIQSRITVGTTAIIARVGGSNLANRKALIIINDDVKDIAWGPNNSVTVTPGVNKGPVIVKDDREIIPVGDSIDIWIVAAAPGGNAIIQEWS